MKKQDTFNIAEVDTLGMKFFNDRVAAGNPEDCREVAAIIMQYSKSMENKRHVKEQVAKMVVQRYGLFGYEVQDFDAGAVNLLNIYSGGNAAKKFDISRDIPIFSELATKFVDENVTLLKYDRLFYLYQSIVNSLELQGDIVELGVYKGGSCKFMCEIFSALRPQSTKQIFAFDTFEGHAHISSHDGARHKLGHFKTDGIESVARYVSNTRALFIQGDASETFPEWIKIGKQISFAHIDMDVYRPTADCLPFVYDRLVRGGSILLDDYGFISCPGAKKATDDFLKTVTATNFHLMSGQMLIIKNH